MLLQSQSFILYQNINKMKLKFICGKLKFSLQEKLFHFIFTLYIDLPIASSTERFLNCEPD